MSWNLFIDDERFPVDVKWAPYTIYNKYLAEEWTICRNKEEVIQEITNHNNIAPSFISWDHDLGKDEPTGYDIVKLMVDMDMNAIITIPSEFEYFTHSKNPIGAKNIQSYLDNYLKMKSENIK